MRDGDKILIVVAGGVNGDNYLAEAISPITSATKTGTNYLDSVEIYDPTNNTWSPGKRNYKKYLLM